jgi:sugar phosphate isomerase/epimerase
MLFARHDRRTTLAAIRDMGFPAVDIWASGHLASQDATGAANLARHIDPAVDDVAALKAELREFGLRLHALSIYRCDTPAKLARVELAAALGADCVIFCADKGDFDRYAEDVVAPVLKRCEALGIRLAIENHIDRAIDTIDTMIRLVRMFPSPSLGYAFAPPHLVAIGESPEEGIRILGAGRLHSVYAWDLKRGYVPQDSIDFGTGEEQMPGGGQIDFATLDAALLEAGYTGTFNLGLHGTSQWPVDKIVAETRNSLAFLEKTFAQSLAGRQLPL